ncbi:hypothetical protein ACH41E_33510 [Streptomyces sp. NPDC020412]
MGGGVENATGTEVDEVDVELVHGCVSKVCLSRTDVFTRLRVALPLRGE